MENNIENRYVPVEEYIEQQLPDSSLIRAERLRDVLKYIYANTEGGGGGSPEVINAIIKQVFGGTNVPEVQDELGSPSILDHLKKGITPKYVTLPQGVSISTYITGESSNVNSTIEVLNNELIYIREYYKTDTNVDVYDGQKVYVLIKGPGKYGKPLTGNTKPLLRSDFGLISDGLVVQGQGGGSAVKSVEDTSPDARGNISLLKKVVRWEDANTNDDPTTFNMVPAIDTASGKTKFIPRDSFEGKYKTTNSKSPDSAGNVDIGIDDTLKVNDVTKRVIEFEDGGINLEVIDEEGLLDKRFFAYSVREKGIFRIGTGCGSSKGGWSAPTFFGYGSMKKLNRNNTTTAIGDITAYGWNSLTAFEGGNNGGITSIGARTLFNFVGTNDPLPTNSYFLTALGVNTLYDFLNGSRNTALGGSSGRRLVTGSYNTFTGAASMQDLVEGSNNTAIGYQVTATLKKGSNNTFIGANLQLSEEEVNDTVIIADGTGKQHFKSDDKGSILPSQTIALIDADETGKAVITKEFIEGNLSGPEQILEILDFYNEMERQARTVSSGAIAVIAHQLDQNTKGPLQYINTSYYDITIDNGVITYEDTGKKFLTLEKLTTTQGFKVDLTGVLVKVFDPNYPETYYLSRTTADKTIVYNDINSFKIEEVFTGATSSVFDYLPAPVTPRVKLINDYLLAGKSFSSGPWEYAVIGKVISTGEMIPDFYYQVSGYVTLIDLSKYDIPKEDIQICFISTVNGTEGPWQPVIGDGGGAN